MLSVTLKDGVIKSESLDRKNNASLDKRNYKLVIPNDIAYNSMRMWQGALGVSKFSGIVSPAYTVIKLRNQLENPYFYQYYFKKNEMLNVFRKNSQGLTSDTWNLKYPLFSRIRFFTTSTREQQPISSLLYLLDQTITLHEEKKRQLERLKSALLQKMFADKSEYPAVRYRGFYAKWEQCKLGDVADIVGGGTPSTKKEEYWNGNINWFSPAEIGNQIFVNQSQKQITELGLKKSSAKMLPVGTVLFTSRAGIGNTAILTREACTNQGFQSIVPNFRLLDSYFLYSKSANLKRYGETMGSGSTFTEVSGKQMRKMPLCIPNIAEQTEIGSMLKTLDHRITLQSQKLKSLKCVKQTLLQKMFI